MDKETIQQIAAEVIARLPFGDRYWLFLAINVIVMASAAGFAAWFGSFLKTKGQNFATKRDFDDLQKQLSANTELVEGIKSEVSQRDWTQREWTNLRRVKLEALLEKMHESEAYLERLRSSCDEGKLPDYEHDPIIELDAIGKLYFPELSNAVSGFYQRSKALAVIALDLGQAISKAGNDPDARQSAYDTYNPRFRALYEDLIYARHGLTAAARSLLERIMNVDEAPRRATSGEARGPKG
jgi:hypothetical protein